MRGSRPSFARACCARVRFVARDVDVARVVVPRRDLVAPPQLPRDAPVLDVVDPVQVGRQPFAGDERHRLAAARARPAGNPVSLDGREAQLLDRAAREERMRRRRRRRHRHEPLVGEHRLDDLAGAAAARHDHLVRLFGDEQAGGARGPRAPPCARRSDRVPRYFAGALSLIFASRSRTCNARQAVPLRRRPSR